MSIFFAICFAVVIVTFALRMAYRGKPLDPATLGYLGLESVQREDDIAPTNLDPTRPESRSPT